MAKTDKYPIMPDYTCRICFIDSKHEYFTTKDKSVWSKHEQTKKHKAIFEAYYDADPATAQELFDKALVISTVESRLQNRIDLLENILKRNNIKIPE